MEKQASYEPSALVLSTSDLRCKIMASLYESEKIKHAFAAFKAFSCVDKASYHFFRHDERVSQELALSLLKITHGRNDILMRVLLEQIAPFLNEQAVEAFEGMLDLSDWLADQCSRYAASHKWNNFLGILSKGLSPFFAQASMHCYWPEAYKNVYTVKKTLLIKALELNAPKEVIIALCALGSQVKDFPLVTPPPCLVVMRNYLKCQKELTTSQGPCRVALEKRLDELEGSMDMLIEKGALLSESFCLNPLELKVQTPLSVAVKAGDLQAVTYVIKKGVTSFDPYVLLEFFCLKEPVASGIREALLTIPSYPEHWLYYTVSAILPKLLHEPTTHYEEAFEELSDLLDKVSDLNVPVPYEEDLSFLDIAQLCGNDQRVLSLLIEKGAAFKEHNKQKVERMSSLRSLQELFKAAMGEKIRLHSLIIASDTPKVLRDKLCKQELLSKSSVDLCVEHILKEVAAAIEEWGFKGVPLPIIENTLCLVDSHLCLSRASEFLKALQLQKEFRPFFLRRKWIASQEQLLFEMSKNYSTYDTECSYLYEIVN